MSLLTTASSFLPPVPAPVAHPAIPRVLAIAGSDPSGGAGIQADLKSIAAHGGYGMAAITALTAQNTRGVSAVHVPPAAFLTAQLDAISEDISIDAVKIGMLGDAAVIDAVRTWLEKARPAVVVLDPVMVATSGDRLLQESAEAALHALLPLRGPDHPQPRRTRHPAQRTRGRELGRRPGAGQAARRPDRHHGPGQGRPPRRRRRLPGRAGQHRRAAGPGRRRGAGGAGAHAQQPRHRMLAVLGDGHRPGQIVGRNGRGTGRRRSARSSPGCRRRCAPRRTSTSAPATARSTISTTSSSTPRTMAKPAASRPRVPSPPRSGTRQPPTSTRSTAWTSSEALADGSLPEKEFAYYLAQDALYLNGYSRVLARAAAIAPTEAEQLFWARSAQNCLEVESELHRTWLSTRPPAERWVRSPSPTWTICWPPRSPAATGCWWPLCCRASGSMPRWGRPCTGSSSPPAPRRRTPTRCGCAPTPMRSSPPPPGRPSRMPTRRRRAASEGERQAMAVAFRQSARYEVDFFDAPRLHA